MGSVIGYQEAHGPVATFETDVAGKIKKLEASIEPIQDLHGYDSPWPAGDGKNKFNPDEAQNNKWINSTTGDIESTNGYWITGYIPVKSGDVVRCTTKGSIRNAWFNADKSQSTYVTYSGGSNGITAPTDGFIVMTVQRSVVGYGSDFLVTINNDDLTFAPYSNICPITGWTGAKVAKCGKNLLPNVKYQNTVSQVVLGQEGRNRFETYLSEGTYKLSVSFSTSSNPNGYMRKKGTTQNVTLGSTYPLTVTITENNYYEFWLNNNSGELSENEISNFQLELGSTATAYEPYVGYTYDITFPSEAGTVYGGKLDIISGQLTVDKTIVDLGTLDWSKSNLTYFKSDSLKSVIKVPVGQKTPADMVCSKYATLSYGQVNTGNKNGIAVIGDTSANDKGLLTINDLALVDSTAEDFKASLTGTTLVYKMNTPITYILTPQEIQTIIGTNTIYADTGDTSVIYPKTITPIETVSNVNLMELRRSIIAAQGNDNLYDKWIWKQEKDDFVIRNNTVGFNEGLGNNIYTEQRSDRENNRRSMVVKRGMVPFVSYDSVSGGTYAPVKMYPIPIPPDAINVQMSCNQQNLVMGGMFLRLANGKYEQMKKNTASLELSRPLWTIIGNNHFFAPYISREDGANFTDTLENVRITFSRNGQWRWTLTNNDLYSWSRSVSWDSTNSRITYSSSAANNYKTIMVPDGLCGYYMDGELQTRAPVPVPPTATKVTVTTTPALQAQMILLKAADDQTQQLITNNGWNATPAVMTFTADDNLELVVALRINSTVPAFTTSETPTEIIIQFE